MAPSGNFQVPTVAIKDGEGGKIVINESDFDHRIHELFDEAGSEPVELTEEQIEAIHAAFDDLEDGDFKADDTPKIGPVRTKSGISDLSAEVMLDLFEKWNNE